MNHSVSISTRAWAIAAAFLIVAGCETTAPAPTVPRVAPEFDYTPPELANDKVDITLAVVGSSVGTSVPVFKDFATNMAQDFMEVLTSLGFRVRGPYDSYDQMTFPDKQGSELLLSAEYDFSHDISGLKAIEVASLSSLLETLGGSTSSKASATYTYSGPVTVTSRITLVLYESLSHERMWTKSLSLSPIEVNLQGTAAFPGYSPPSLADLLTEEDKFFTDLGKELGAQYQEAMRSTYVHLDPKEVAMVSRQADTLRERKRY